MDNIKLLNNLGLEEHEAQIFFLLLKKGRQTVLQIARFTDIPRTTVYRIIESLEKKNFIERVIKGKTSFFDAVPLDRLDFLVKEKESAMLQTQSTLRSLMEMGIQGFNKASGTSVKHYQGRSGFRQMMWNALSADKNVVGYSQFGRVAVVGENFYSLWVKEFKLRGLQDRVITNQKGFSYINKYVVNSNEDHQLQIENIHFLDEGIFDVTGDTSIYNDTYAVCFWNDQEIVGVEIQNPNLVSLHKSIFEILWNLSNPYRIEQENRIR